MIDFSMLECFILIINMKQDEMRAQSLLIRRVNLYIKRSVEEIIIDFEDNCPSGLIWEGWRNS